VFYKIHAYVAGVGSQKLSIPQPMRQRCYANPIFNSLYMSQPLSKAF
jgi:hypothetical protein